MKMRSMDRPLVHAMTTVWTAFLFLPSLPAGAQDCGTWSQVASDGPTPRSYARMVFDSRRDVTVLFGGSRSLRGLGDTWEWDGATWRLVATTGPAPREKHAMVYDSVRGVTLLFGGTEPYSTKYNDTWEWDGVEWRRVAIGGPTPRFLHAMAFDSARGVAVLFGGTGERGNLRDTWEWDGSIWNQVADGGPTGRYNHSMAHDAARGVTLLFGGLRQGTDRSRTWKWDGATWSIAATTGPPPRVGTAMAYDSARQATILFGGSDTAFERLGDTWEWDGGTWTRVADSGPSPRTAHDLAYDATREVVLAFGGSSNADTWTFGGSAGSIHMTPLYSACPGTGPGAVSWACGSPNGEVALLFAQYTGQFRIPIGPCAGVRLGLGWQQLRVVKTGLSDARGRGRIEVEHGPQACGGHVQILDVSTCATSNVVLVE